MLLGHCCAYIFLLYIRVVFEVHTVPLCVYDPTMKFADLQGVQYSLFPNWGSANNPLVV